VHRAISVGAGSKDDARGTASAGIYMVDGAEWPRQDAVDPGSARVAGR
jgi:hypothetical protein